MIEIWENDTVLQKQLKKRLNARRWTHNDLAEAAEMPISTVRDIVHRGREPYAYNLRKIADCLDATMDELTTEDRADVTWTELYKQALTVMRSLSHDQLDKAFSYIMYLRERG